MYDDVRCTMYNLIANIAIVAEHLVSPQIWITQSDGHRWCLHLKMDED